MAGDLELNNDDHSAADFALCILLAKKHACNAFKIDAEFRTSACTAISGSAMTTAKTQSRGQSRPC